MLSIQHIQAQLPKVIEQLTTRGLVDAGVLVGEVLKKNEERISCQLTVEKIAIELKTKTQAIMKLAKQGKQARIAEIKQEIAVLKSTHKKLALVLKEKELALKNSLCQLPNLPLEEVPIGKNANDNQVVAHWEGDSMQEPTTRLPHWELIKQYDLVSFEWGNKIAAAGFPVYKGKGAKLQRALIAYFLAMAEQAGYEEVQPPILVNTASAFGTGQLPDKEKVMYKVVGEDLFLIPTAEVPVTNLYRGQVLQEKELPIRHVAYTPCFRTEAGSWGRSVRGLNRLHQFDKVEIVEITTAKNSLSTLQKMYDHIANLLKSLGLRYRVLKLCTGDLGFTSAITYDFEVWAAGQEQWLEVSSVSCFGDYQARRMKLRYKQGKQKFFCHTLNGSALALPRVLAALFENNQTMNNIVIPPVLHPYTGFKEITL